MTRHFGWRVLAGGVHGPRRRRRADLADDLGIHRVITAPVRFARRGEEWLTRVAGRRAVGHDISYDSDKDRWYQDASWKTTAEQVPALEELRASRVHRRAHPPVAPGGGQSRGVDCDADWVTDRVAAGIQHTGGEVVGVEIGPQPLCQVEIQAGEMPAGLRPHCRARRGVVVQHPPAVPVVAAFRQYEPTAKQRKVSRG
jgi:hypothetical protein